METQTFRCIEEFHSIDGITEKGTIIIQKEYWRLSAVEREFFKVVRQ